MKNIYLFSFLLFFAIEQSFAQRNNKSHLTDDSTYLFADLPLEELMKIKITTASTISQNENSAAATTIVITEKQINIRGYQTLLDVLRDLPDFKVDDNSSSSSGNTITIRGINGQYKFITN
jgi:outer membrane receptor for ferrienterochelin and colicin